MEIERVITELAVQCHIPEERQRRILSADEVGEDMPQVIHRPARFRVATEHHPPIVPSGEEIIA